MELILVKHSLPAIDPAAPSDSWLLNDTGRRRCRRLADLLAPHSPATLVTSPEPKARETASLLADRLGGEVTVERNLREQERDALGWLGDDAFERAVVGAMERPSEKILGMEPIELARSRFAETIERLIVRHAPGNVIVVAHGTVFSLFAAPLLGLPTVDLWKRLGMPSFVALTVPDFAPVELVDRIVEEDRHEPAEATGG